MEISPNPRELSGLHKLEALQVGMSSAAQLNQIRLNQIIYLRLLHHFIIATVETIIPQTAYDLLFIAHALMALAVLGQVEM